MNGSPRALSALACLALMLAAGAPARASQQGDSLHGALDGESTAAQRAEVLLDLSTRSENAQPGESLVHARNALAFAEQDGDRRLIHRALTRIRDLQYHFAAQDDFLRSAIRAMELSQAISDAGLMASDLQWLAIAYEQLGDLDKAVEMSRKALFLLTTTGDSAAMGRGMLHLLNALVKAGRFEEVIRQSGMAMKYFTAQNDSAGQSSVWIRSAEALMAQGHHGDALPLLHKADRVLMITDQYDERLRVLAALTEAYLALDRADRARDFIGTALALSAQHGLRSQKPRLLGLCSRVDEAEGDLNAALACQRAHALLEDSLFSEHIAERMAGMQAIYEMSQKERDYEALLERNTANETLVASERARGRWLFGAAGLLLLLLGGSIFLLISHKRVVRRIKLKNQVIRQQAEEIHQKNLELERQNLRLAETLISEEEKGVLLKEIHHRVKNNLQIVNTLLRLQAGQHHDARLEAIFDESQNRIRAMAMVHEHIYRHGDLARIDVRDHLLVLAGAVLKNYGMHERIELEVQADMTRATLDTLIPLSLMVNELMTNAARHAFPGDRRGRVRILLRCPEGRECELFFSDDGVGMDRQRMFNKGSIGLELIHTLAAQLDGHVRTVNGDGTIVVATFSPAELRRKAG